MLNNVSFGNTNLLAPMLSGLTRAVSGAANNNLSNHEIKSLFAFVALVSSQAPAQAPSQPIIQTPATSPLFNLVNPVGQSNGNFANMQFLPLNQLASASQQPNNNNILNLLSGFINNNAASGANQSPIIPPQQQLPFQGFSSPFASPATAADPSSILAGLMGQRFNPGGFNPLAMTGGLSQGPDLSMLSRLMGQNPLNPQMPSAGFSPFQSRTPDLNSLLSPLSSLMQSQSMPMLMGLRMMMLFLQRLMAMLQQLSNQACQNQQPYPPEESSAPAEDAAAPAETYEEAPAEAANDTAPIEDAGAEQPYEEPGTATAEVPADPNAGTQPPPTDTAQPPTGGQPAADAGQPPVANAGQPAQGGQAPVGGAQGGQGVPGGQAAGGAAQPEAPVDTTDNGTLPLDQQERVVIKGGGADGPVVKEYYRRGENGEWEDEPYKTVEVTREDGNRTEVTYDSEGNVVIKTGTGRRDMETLVDTSAEPGEGVYLRNREDYNQALEHAQNITDEQARQEALEWLEKEKERLDEEQPEIDPPQPLPEEATEAGEAAPEIDPPQPLPEGATEAGEAAPEIDPPQRMPNDLDGTEYI